MSKNNLSPVLVKSMNSSKSTHEVFAFFSDAKNMELGGVIQSVKKSSGEWYTFDHILAGKSRMKHIVNPEFKRLDHVFQGGGLEWKVFVRVYPNRDGSTITWTFIKPDGLSDRQFEEQLKNFDLEIDAWKEAL